jgi:hypothetical protein
MKRSLITLGCGLLVAALSHTAWAISITVNTVDGLNNAIARAEGDPANSYTVIVSPSSTPYALNRTFTITKAKLEVRATTITNPGGTVLDAANLRQIFNVSKASGQTSRLWITGLTLKRGNSGTAHGGCIAVSNTELVVSHSVLEGCRTGQSGGAIFASDARLTVFQTIIRDNQNPAWATGGGGGGLTSNGGGVFAQGASTVDIYRSTFTQNIAARGGGLALHGTSTLLMRNSTFSGNKAMRGAGLIIRNSGSVRMRFNTITANTAGAASGSTEPKMGGGLAFVGYTGLLEFQGNILAGNNTMIASTNDRGEDCYIDDPMNVGRWDEAMYFTNLIGRLDRTCDGKLGTVGYIIGSPSSPIDARLAALGNNGTSYGPVVPTHMPQPGSPIFGSYLPASGPGNTGTGPPCLTDDQRVKPRRSSPGRCDIGAVEATGN